MDVVRRVHHNKVKAGCFPANTNLLSIDGDNALLCQQVIHDLDTIPLDHGLWQQVGILLQHLGIDIRPLLADLDAHAFASTRSGNGGPDKRSSNPGKRVKHGHTGFGEELDQLRHELGRLVGTVLLAKFVAVHSRVGCRQDALRKVQEAISPHVVERILRMGALQILVFIFCHMDTTMVSSRQQNLSLFLSLGVLFAYITIFVDEFRA